MTPRRQLGWVCVVLMGALGAEAHAQARVEQAPVVLLLRSGHDKETARQEQRFFDELSLVLDDFAIFSQAPDESGFFERPLAQQVASVERMAAENLAVAGVWLEPQARERVAVHLVAANTGRTLVRTVEVKGKEKPQAVLALTVRELLGTAFLFEPEKARQTPAVRSVVETVRQEVVTLAAAEGPRPEPVPASSAPFAALTVGGGPFVAQGLWGQVGPSLRVGGRLIGETGGPVWRGGLGLEASGWPGLTTASVSVSGWELAFGLEGSARWGTERLRVGPTVGAHAVYEAISGWTAQGPRRFSSWRARALVGAAASWQVTDRWRLGLATRLELNQAQLQALQSDFGTVVTQSPWGSLRLELTLTFI